MKKERLFALISSHSILVVLEVLAGKDGQNMPSHLFPCPVVHQMLALERRQVVAKQHFIGWVEITTQFTLILILHRWEVQYYCRCLGELSVKIWCLFVCLFFHDISANKKKFSDRLALFRLSVNQQNTMFVQFILDGKSRDLSNEQRLFNLLGRSKGLCSQGSRDPSPMINFVSGCRNYSLTLFDCLI